MLYLFLHDQYLLIFLLNYVMMEQIYIFLYKRHNDNHHDDEYSLNEMMMMRKKFDLAKKILLENYFIKFLIFFLLQVYLNFHFHHHFHHENQHQNQILQNSFVLIN